MDWINFPLYSCVTAILLIFGNIVSFIPIKKRQTITYVFTISAILFFGSFIAQMWIHLERPPMRTLGETRLWYAFFLPLIGLLVYKRWKYNWFLLYSNFMALLFLIINLIHPENYSKTLMPALQSSWFVPHVVVYIFAYALLGASSIVAAYSIFLLYIKKLNPIKELYLADNLVYIGFAFLTLGLLFGALWAKEAWGNYWTWDPKETWALLTYLAYLIYIHFRHQHKNRIKLQLWILSISFVVLLLAWYGVNYMPSAKNSVHTYSQND